MNIPEYPPRLDVRVAHSNPPRHGWGIFDSHIIEKQKPTFYLCLYAKTNGTILSRYCSGIFDIGIIKELF